MWLVVVAVLAASSVAQEVKLVEIQQGELPIILSAPHDGSLDVPGAQPRSGNGLVAKPGGFVTARDTGTAPLAQQLSAEIEKRFGRKPYLVINRAHRKFMDPNRPPAEAFETEATQKVYEEYHQFLSQACEAVRDKYQAGLLLDIHGQGSRRNTVFRGTQNGLTMQLLRNRFGENAHVGDQSFFGMLRKRQFTVFPDPFDGKEQAGFTGGFIVKNYGSHSTYAIDAIQLEFGGLYRAADNRHSAASALADAVAEYAATYLKLETTPHDTVNFQPKPEEAKPVEPTVNLNDPEFIDIAIYTGEGASQVRTKLLATLKSKAKVRVHDRTAEEIRQGKLAGMEIVLHPGGSGGGQGRALGAEGREEVRKFIAQGGGYIGICAGSYLATCHYDWSLNILDAHVIDREHWARGKGNVEIDINAEGKNFFSLEQPTATIWYANGPLLGPGNNPSIPDYEPLALYKSEIAKNDAPPGIMLGTTAIARGRFEAGKVICFSCHPEITDDRQTMLHQAIDWVKPDNATTAVIRSQPTDGSDESTTPTLPK
jgi:N-formylglutamate amidohydrolase/glutamine amidotransferase PdxT